MHGLRRIVLLVLAFALVAAQALGWMHRIVHHPQAATASALQAGPQAASLQDAATAEGMAGLFAHQADDATCRLFDLLNQHSLPAAPLLALPQVFSQFYLSVLQGEFLARWAALFDARGPPALR